MPNERNARTLFAAAPVMKVISKLRKKQSSRIIKRESHFRNMFIINSWTKRKKRKEKLNRLSKLSRKKNIRDFFAFFLGFVFYLWLVKSKKKKNVLCSILPLCLCIFQSVSFMWQMGWCIPQPLRMNKMHIISDWEKLEWITSCELWQICII